MIQEHRLAIGNEDQPTYYLTRIDNKGKSMIDLTLAKELFGKLSIMDRNYAMASDHEIIEWEENMEKQEEAGGTQVVGWKPAALS